MMLGSFYFKQKAREALKGNWQTALVVAFFSGVFMTAGEVFQALKMPIYLYTDGTQPMVSMGEISNSTWIIFGIISLLSMLLTPVLAVGCNHYFVQRLQGTELGAKGLWSRMGSFFKALWLYVRMGVQIFLWGLLLVVPGIIAALRYAMAPYYLAEHPEMTVGEALEASKKTMKTLKTSYFSLMLSFMGWMFLSYAIQMMFIGMSGIIATMAGLFMQVWIAAYTNAAVASFYLTASSEQGMVKAQREMNERMRQMGVEPEAWSRPDDEDETLDAEPDDSKDQPEDRNNGGE